MTYARVRILVILAASAVIGATAIAFASDLISRRDMSQASPIEFISLSDDGDTCPPNACSVVVKAEGAGRSSQVLVVH